MQRLEPPAGHRRAGHRDWNGTDWTRYRAHVTPDTFGHWTIRRITVHPGDDLFDTCAIHGAPCAAGTYNVLEHHYDGTVMTDAPSETAGMIAFTEQARGRVLVSGLGLGILPAYLLHHAPVTRIDVIENRASLICMLDNNPGAQHWIRDPRLRIHHGDTHTIELRGEWDYAFHSIWGLPHARNLHGMRRLTTRWATQAREQHCWEEAECRALAHETT